MTKPERFMWVIALLSALQPSALSQHHRVELDSLTTLDDPPGHLEIFTLAPAKNVVLPHVDTTGARFLTVFYSWRMTNAPEVVIMVLPSPGGDRLYIDRNFDNDLSNDGPPIFFPADQNELKFDIAPSNSPDQKAKLVLARKPNVPGMPDSIKAKYSDPEGNLNLKFSKFWGTLKGNPDFKGERGTFYWDDRVSVRRGTLVLRGKPHAIGIFDYSNNGLFDDDDDLLLVDLRGSGRLTYSDNAQVFKLNDVFTLAGENWKILRVDRYGRSLELERTSQAPTGYFIHEQDSSTSAGRTASVQTMRIDSSLWSVKGLTIDGKAIALSDYRGKYLLLNFWGEWCKPCVEEIPALVAAADSYGKSNLRPVGFLKAGNLEKAKQLISDSKMSWPQILLTPELEDQFKITAYPTNILLLPNGTDGVRTFGVDGQFFKRYLR